MEPPQLPPLYSAATNPPAQPASVAPAPAPPPSATHAFSSPPAMPWIKGKIALGRVDDWVMTADETARHLLLLHAFHQLKLQVERHAVGIIADLNPAERWLGFLHVASRRLRAFLSSFAAEDAYEELPLDCALVWHAWILSSRWYREDCLRLYSTSMLTKGTKLLTAKGLPLKSITDRLTANLELLEGRPGVWLEKTGYAFDPLESLSQIKSVKVRCPRCETKNYPPLVNKSRTGFGQDFAIPCVKCQLVLTQEALGIGRLLFDLRIPQYPEGKFPRYDFPLTVQEADTTLAGTLVTPTRFQNYAGPARVAASRFKRRILLALGSLDTAGDRMGWNLAGAKRVLADAIGGEGGRPLAKILSAYTTSHRFSLDLPQAVLRQGDFVDKMFELGWTAPGRFNVDATDLYRSIIRYHAFLDLAYTVDSRFLVPTLDIDLVWHTDMLHGGLYAHTCEWNLSFVLEHDDTVEESLLANGYEETATQWEAHFGVPYSTCGCSISPPDPQPSTGVSKILSKLSFASPKISKHAKQLVPGLLLDADSDAAKLASHPSEHNSVVVLEDSSKEEGFHRAGDDEIKSEYGSGEKVSHALAFSKGRAGDLRSFLRANQPGTNITGAGACSGSGCGATRCASDSSGYPTDNLFDPAQSKSSATSSRPIGYSQLPGFATYRSG